MGRRAASRSTPTRVYFSADMIIANRGLPEVEVTSRHEIAITLLRCVGWLSRDDFSTRTGHAGPFLETPKAQMQGEWEFPLFDHLESE